MDALTEEIFQLYKEVYPTGAFAHGIEDCKNKLFIPSKENKQRYIKRIDRLLRETKDKKKQLILKCIKGEIKFSSPESAISSLSYAIFEYDTKGEKIEELLKRAKELFEVYLKEELPSLGARILTIKALDDLLHGLKQGQREKVIGRSITTLKRKFAITAPLDQDHITVELTKTGFGRKEAYREMVRDQYNLLDDPEAIEKQCCDMLDRMLIEFEAIKKKIEQKYSVKGTAQVDALLLKRTNKDVLKVAQEWRKKVTEIVRQHLITIPPYHKVKVVLTPPYMQVGIAAASAINLLKGDFENVLFLTKEAKSNKYFLLDVVVHEEVGHNVNYSCSKDADLLSKLIHIRTAYTTGEMLATSMEKQFYELLNKVNISEEEDFNLFYTYMFLRRMLIVYARAIVDVRINLEKQTFGECIEWAHKKTGMSKESLFREFFGFLFHPGYSLSYPVGLHKLEDLRKKSKLSQKEFNTRVWSLGLPPLEILEEEIKRLR